MEVLRQMTAKTAVTRPGDLFQPFPGPGSTPEIAVVSIVPYFLEGFMAYSPHDQITTTRTNIALQIEANMQPADETGQTLPHIFTDIVPFQSHHRLHLIHYNWLYPFLFS